jgi:hypothetical protein
VYKKQAHRPYSLYCSNSILKRELHKQYSHQTGAAGRQNNAGKLHRNFTPPIRRIVPILWQIPKKLHFIQKFTHLFPVNSDI